MAELLRVTTLRCSPLRYSTHLLRWALLLCSFFCSLCLVACNQPVVHQQEAFVFGTRVEVVVYGESDARARAATSAVLQEFDRLHHRLHAWQPSELTQLNAALAKGETALVSAELGQLLLGAQAVAQAGRERTEVGAAEELFDPAIGGLIAAWGFHADEFKPVLPEPDRLAKWLAAHPRMHDLHIEPVGEQYRVRSDKPEVQIDLGGYAKGYALDRARALLKAQGVTNALINIGGNVLALGSKGGQPWRVGIQHPRSGQPLAALDLRDGEAIGTSGDYQRFFEIDGRRYCHLLDPRTGQPATTAQSVTVLISPHTTGDGNVVTIPTPIGKQDRMTEQSAAHNATQSATQIGVGTLSDAASKPLFLAAAPNLQAVAGALGVDQLVRVDAQGQVFVTRAMQQRVHWSDPAQRVDVLAW